jgi:hypothetical protein
MSANKSTLIEYLTDSVSYDSSWAIYAERVEGKWKPESFARFGQCIYENGGLMDDCELFRTNESIVNAREAYTEGDDEFIQEWAERYIEEMNEAYHRLGL